MNDMMHCDLAIIGTGIGGMAAAIFAANRGLSVVQAGSTGAVAYTSGVFDVLGALPSETADGRPTVVRRPFAALNDLLRIEPDHPYAGLLPEEIRAAFAETLAFLADIGLPYQTGGEKNFSLPTPAGTIKHSWCVPETALAGCLALESKQPALIVALHGLKGFSSRQIAANLAEVWPGLQPVSVSMPGHTGGELYPEQAARMLETASARKALAEVVAPHVHGVEAVGFPAVLGMHRPGDVTRDLAERLAVPVFEIPTMPPGVPGIRLKEALESALPERGVALFCQQKMSGIVPGPDDPFVLRITGQPVERQVRAAKVLLCSGRFLGGGLAARRDRGIVETVFDLAVRQPESRSGWHHPDYFDPRGHPVHRTGLVVDQLFRPLAENGRPVHPGLHAAGSILANQDWIRMKCGAGVAIATAYKAVEALRQRRQKNDDLGNFSG